MNRAAGRAPSRLRGVVQLVAIVAILLLGVAALNWPITFATATHPTSTPTAQVSQPTVTAQGGSTTGSVSSRSQSSQDANQTAADVAAKANPAVVTVTNYQPPLNPFTNQAESSQAVPYGVGSGYIVDDQGHVVTNNHVVAGGTAFEVQFYDGTTVDATVVGTDPFQDVAVLKLDLKAGQRVPGVLGFGDSDTVRPGDQVIAIGTPYGEYANTVTTGSVGAVNRALDTGDGYALPNLIQHSAPIYEGDSGGPLLNMSGQVIGMNVAKATQSPTGVSGDDQTGIGFAIASDAVKDIVDQIIATGKVSRAYLGVRTLQDGQSVVSVEAGSPAADAGLEAGDVITAMDGQDVDATHPFLNMLIFDHKPGDKVDLTVDRDGQSLTVSVTLGERPAETQ
ncbi:MAG TPA: trypsin-like peptidase domain-containing protein [Thermomicrobiales bacterium]|jgi:S1-C subfamily serine protease